MDELRTAMDDGLIYPGTIGWKDIESDHARGLETCLRYMRDKYKPITDIAREISGWWCFQKDRPPRPSGVSPALSERLSSALLDMKHLTDPMPLIVHRTEPKVGRNGPCPCGSGRKFKKCCGG